MSSQPRLYFLKVIPFKNEALSGELAYFRGDYSASANGSYPAYTQGINGKFVRHDIIDQIIIEELKGLSIQIGTTKTSAIESKELRQFMNLEKARLKTSYKNAIPITFEFVNSEAIGSFLIPITAHYSIFNPGSLVVNEFPPNPPQLAIINRLVPGQVELLSTIY